MSDYSGFRTVYTLGEETEAMRAASYAVMNKTRANRVFRASGRAKSFHPSVPNLGATISGPLLAAGMAGGTVGTMIAGIGGALAIDYYIGEKIGSMQERIYKKFGME